MRYLLFLIFITFSLISLAESEDNLSQEEREEKLLNFTNIKSVLKNDGLIEQRLQKKKLIKQMGKERSNIKSDKYRYPESDDFWALMSELWLVKNAQVLQWDFPKPEYGIAQAFKGLLEKLGYYNEDVKLLVVNTPNIAHMALPAGKNETIFILSLPFMRTLDLTKVDLAIILLEDFLRVKSNYFQANSNVDMTKLGTNFIDKSFDNTLVSTTLKEYSNIAFTKGFTFQQQYEVTKKMSELLKSYPALWSSYYKVLTKINRLIQNDLLYKGYLKIYPSPELQLQWLKPKKTVL